MNNSTLEYWLETTKQWDENQMLIALCDSDLSPLARAAIEFRRRVRSIDDLDDEMPLTIAFDLECNDPQVRRAALDKIIALFRLN